MAHTLKPDPAFQRFNRAKEVQGHYFRFTTRSALFNVLMMGIVPVGLTYWAYAENAQLNFHRKFRSTKIFDDDEYVPRDKDL